MIDAALQYLGIKHEYEPRLQINGQTIYPDFDLGNGIYLEYWGLKTKAYLQRRKKKMKLYKAKKLKVINIENEDLKGILATLRNKLRKFPQFQDKFTKY
ncbi:unnamed protein product [marine sediment metagenome]|uniref:Uncharacterized protein n=1 Tax=marine sediment metagenome TaxID=412755 RepID=X1A5C5_9ZZZZ